MFKRIDVSTQFLALGALAAIAVLWVGVVGVQGLRASASAGADVALALERQSDLGDLAGALQDGLEPTMDAVLAGRLSWEEAEGRLAAQRGRLERAWRAAARTRGGGDAAASVRETQQAVTAARSVFEEAAALLEARDQGQLFNFRFGPYAELAAPLFGYVQDGQAAVRQSARAGLERIERQAGLSTLVTGGSAVAALLVLVALGGTVYLFVTRRLRRVLATTRRVLDGEEDARSGLGGDDDLGRLGDAVDRILDEREGLRVRMAEENSKLNDAVIDLLQTVASLAQRDLTTRAVVTEDATGPVADALNLLADETSKVLSEVVGTAHLVAASSTAVKHQSDTVINVATLEREEVEKTAGALAHASDAMLRIARLAKSSNEAADKTMQATAKAQDTVLRTVDGITAVRDTIRQTEKRIKRLGERSQEISGAVNLINGIAERTHILALNASMHAASAGEAGRGFAVVADEVQRLAQSARDATAQIATLVSSIQTETADTVGTMNEAITRVVSGSQLAEQAGSEMRATQESTAALVKMVQMIAKDSQHQAAATRRLQESAEGIRNSTEQTFQQLQDQLDHTDRLAVLAARLLEAVSVFTLPAALLPASNDHAAAVDAADPGAEPEVAAVA